MKSIRKQILISLFLTSVTVFFVTCNDPVFYTIAQEMKPASPRISGSVSNIVAFNGYMYVAQTRNLWKYNSLPDPVWENERLDNPIVQLATDGKGKDYLYILFYQDTGSSIQTFIKVRNAAGDFPEDEFSIPDRVIQSIFFAEDLLLIGTRMTDNSTHFEVFAAKIDSTANSLIIANNAIEDLTGNMTGAAFDGTDYFVSTTGGVFKFSYSSDIESISATRIVQGNYAAIINIPDTASIVALTRNGQLHGINNTSGHTYITNFSGNATGAIAIGEDVYNPSNKLLLAGRTFLSTGVSSGYTHGYLEIPIDTAATANFGIEADAEFREPGLSPISSIRTGGNERYKSTIGRQPVMHIFQAPEEIDVNMTLFASTQRNGLWSYRNRDGVFHWNAEQ